MVILIESGEIFLPERLGKGVILVVGKEIIKVWRSADFDPHFLNELPKQLRTVMGEVHWIDASGCVVTPGWIDPHEHLLGGSGEKGFAMQTPEIALSELVCGGITTVVGCLGVDSRMKTMAGLLAKAKGYNEEGLSAFIYSGGYNVPPTSIMHSLRDDLLFISEVIGAGELAISDERCTEPTPQELARLVSDTHIGGLLSTKAGVTHFHVGDGRRRLEPLRQILDHFEIRGEWLYPTHVERNEKLMLEAIDLTSRGSTVDVDISGEDLKKWLTFYFEQGGSPEKLTLSTDASIKSPTDLRAQLKKCLEEKKFSLEQLLPLVTTNTAKVLRLPKKGRIQEGYSADLLVLEADSFELRDVIAQGRCFMREGKLTFKERFLEESDREIHLVGRKAS